jgi:hypothetical protein
MPEESVKTGVVGARVPPPDVTAKETSTPETGLPPESIACTDGRALTEEPATASCASVETLETDAAVPGPVGLAVADCVLVKDPDVNVRV